MWQALHPKSYVEPQRTARGTYTTRAGSNETESTDLTPFYEDSNSFWDSDGVKATETFGYAYPETQAWNFKTGQEYQASVNTAINRLYRGSSLATILRDSSPGNLSPAAQMKKQPEVQPEDPPVQAAEASSVETSAIEQQPESQPEVASTQDRGIPSVKAFSARKSKVMVTATDGHHGPADQKPMEEAGTERNLPKQSEPKESNPQEDKHKEAKPQESKPKESKEQDSNPQNSRLKHYTRMPK